MTTSETTKSGGSCQTFTTASIPSRASVTSWPRRWSPSFIIVAWVWLSSAISIRTAPSLRWRRQQPQQRPRDLAEAEHLVGDPRLRRGARHAPDHARRLVLHHRRAPRLLDPPQARDAVAAH